MKKILMILVILSVALGLMLWRKAKPEQKPLSAVDAAPERPKVQSTNLVLNAETNVSQAPTEAASDGPSPITWQPPAGDRVFMEQRRAADLLYLESIVALDVRDGINQEVREKERQMRQVSETFRKGMPLRLITERLGGPYAIQTNIMYNLITTANYERGVRHKEYIQNVDFYYSPREGLRFDGHNGAGNQNLLLRLDTNYQLVAWQWHRPTVFMSSESGMWYKPR